MLNSVEPTPAQALSLSTCPLTELSSAVHLAISSIGVGARSRFGARKVFVSAVLEALAHAGHTVDSEVVKLRLVDAHRRGLLSLVRADLIAAMPVDVVIASEIQDRWSTFHFVVDVVARDPWETPAPAQCTVPAAEVA